MTDRHAQREHERLQQASAIGCQTGVS
jgi:hypothetical protein